MFKVSDDFDSNDDFLEEGFTDDFLSSTAVPIESSSVRSEPNPHLAGSSKSFAAKSSSVGTTVRPSKKSSDGDATATPTRSTWGPRGVTGGFQHKTKTHPVSLITADTTRSTHFKKGSPDNSVSHRHVLNGTGQSSCGNDERILYQHCSANSTEMPYLKKPPVSSHSSPLSSISLNNVENRNSEFLAEWNDDSFFNATKEKQQVTHPAVPSHTPEVVTRRVNRSVRQRRFPGPAGLLPPRQGNTSLIAPEEFLNELKSEDNDPAYQETEILSQSSGSVFEGGAWSAMLEDLGSTGLPLLKSMNLASIKAIGRNVRSYKVPFLGVLVQSIDASLPDAAVVFKDPTGEMHGVIHRDVWDQFSLDIAVGTVLVLRNVGIISAGVSSRKQVVNITGNNLTAIYSPKDELNIQLRRIHEFASSTSSKLLAEWEKVESQTANSASPMSRRVLMQPRSSLFHGFQAGGGFSGSIAGTADSYHPSHTNGNPMFRPVTPSFNRRSGPMAPSFNQRSGPMAPNFNERSGQMAPRNNQRNVPSAPSLNQTNSWRNKPTDQGLNPSNVPADRISGPKKQCNDPMAPNTRLNSGAKAPSTTSPFSPMLSRQGSLSTNQPSPVTSTNENSTSTGNNKFVQKSPFTMKAPVSSRPSPQPSPNRFNSNQTSSLKPKAPPTCPPSTVPVKKPKICQNVALSSTDRQKKNPFEVDSDTSAIDTLLEGIDSDSLFGDF